eukprot:5750341-Pleurochrysis_carterae.AAC.1
MPTACFSNSAVDEFHALRRSSEAKQSPPSNSKLVSRYGWVSRERTYDAALYDRACRYSGSQSDGDA